VGVTGRPSAWRVVLALGVVTFVAALVAARVAGPSGPWLWNLDLPKIDYPLASFFHDALAGGRLPLWNDELGLGFPLYAEGQVGAFYPPNWLIFQLPPLVALDVTRVLHLTLGGVGAGCLVLRLAGSRTGAFAAALTAVLSGAITAKLEWHNLVAAYAFVPWVLLPLVRRPGPTRPGLVAAGALFGIQALAGHPNTWLLTGLTAAIVLLAISPRPGALARVAGFGLLGAAVGAVQLIPTAILTTLSVRSRALSSDDLFTSAATPFDILGFAFQGAFVRVAGGAWDPFTGWYPDGTFALLEAAAYVGLPVLALAAIGSRARRVRPFLVAIGVLVAIPIAAAFRPEPWTAVPVLNALRSPVRAYLFVALLLAVLAGVGIGRLGRVPGAIRRAGLTVGVTVAAFGATVDLVLVAPAAFDQLLLASSTFLGPTEVAARRALARAALTEPWPHALDLVAGLAILAVVGAAAALPDRRRGLAAAALVSAAVPLVLLGPLPNGTRDRGSFSYADGEFVRAVAAAQPNRVLTLDPPGFYGGMPDQLAAAGLPDLRMFSSLDLLATTDITERAARDDPSGSLRRALGVDVVVTFGVACPGRQVADAPSERAAICRDEAALRPPYWIPLDAVRLGSAASSPIRPRDAEVDVDRALAASVAATAVERGPTSLTAWSAAPADGWLWIDRAWWPAWRTTVDGEAVETVRGLAGQLVPLSAGRHTVGQELVPWDALAGLGLGLVALAIAAWWAGLAGLARRWRPGRPARGSVG
jgi:hypothetical protein